MARYIDADKFTERIKASPAFRNVDDGLLLQRVVIDVLNNMPTADVAPKSEVEKIFEEMDNILNDYKLSERGLRLTQHEEPSINQRYTELKKKYTEENK